MDIEIPNVFTIKEYQDNIVLQKKRLEEENRLEREKHIQELIDALILCCKRQADKGKFMFKYSSKQPESDDNMIPDGINIGNIRPIVGALIDAGYKVTHEYIDPLTPRDFPVEYLEISWTTPVAKKESESYNIGRFVRTI